MKNTAYIGKRHFTFYEPDPANPKPAYKRTDRHILTYDKNAHTITEKQAEGKKTYSFEEYDVAVQERKQTDFFEPYVFDMR